MTDTKQSARRSLLATLQSDRRFQAHSIADHARDRYHEARKQLRSTRQFYLDCLSRYPWLDCHFPSKQADHYSWLLAEALEWRRAYYAALRVTKGLERD